MAGPGRSRQVARGLAALALTTTALAACSGDEPTADPDRTRFTQPTDPAPDPGQGPSDGPTSPEGGGAPQLAGVVARQLAAPWGLAFLPDGTAIVTERDTRRVLAIEDGQVREVGRLGQLPQYGEAGLLGVAVSPTFAADRRLFFYLTSESDNRVVRATYDGTRLGEPEPILTGIPRGFIHDGGRMVFGPDGHLYVSTGDAGEAANAQDRASLAGKILRIDQDGQPAQGNPDPNSPVWTLGHRNVQGLAFDDEGRLWASEFGASSFDELNLVEKGHNYGWPEVEGRGGTPAYTDPVVTWRTDEASPSGLAFHDGRLWLASLRGERLWSVEVRAPGEQGEPAGNPTPHLVGEYGRLRTVVPSPDGELWLTTSNRDTRGNPKPQDDRILRLTLR